MLFYYFTILFSLYNYSFTRSIYRLEHNKNIPALSARWILENGQYIDNNKHILYSHYLEDYAIFYHFDKKYLLNKLLPKDNIKCKKDGKITQFDGNSINSEIEELLNEIFNNKREYSKFKIIKSLDFNQRSMVGNLVLKFKDYPFILKLYIETPESFTKPFNKSWQSSIFFAMGGGINRFLSGMTRIKNLDSVKNDIINHKKFKNLVNFPRKWFWLPKNSKWIELKGINIGKKENKIIIPAIYAIVVDEINIEREFSLYNKDDKELAIKICNYLDSRIDAHISNFVIEKGSKKIFIIDTEHFPSLVGMKESFKFNSYFEWYIKLTKKAIFDKFFRTKKFRLSLQENPYKPFKY